MIKPWGIDILLKEIKKGYFKDRRAKIIFKFSLNWDSKFILLPHTSPKTNDFMNLLSSTKARSLKFDKEWLFRISNLAFKVEKLLIEKRIRF